MRILAKRWSLCVVILQLYLVAVLVEANKDYGTFLIDYKYCKISPYGQAINCRGINVEGLNYSEYKFYFDTSFFSVRFEDSVIQTMPTGILCEECGIFEMVNCSLESLRVEDFNRWRQLRRVNLSHNKLSYLPEHTFSALDSASHFDLSYNQLTALPVVLFNSTELSTINFSHNRIGFTPNFDTLRLARNVNLSYNNLTAANLHFLSYMKDLLSLDLSGNCLGDIPLPTFAANANLTQLKLNDTCIKDIKLGTFPHTSLKELDLSNNDLSYLNYLVLYPVRFLEKIYLDNTNVSQYNIDHIITEFPIREIGLQGGKYGCLYLIDWLRMTKRNLTLHVYPEKAVWNRPNINGVACI